MLEQFSRTELIIGKENLKRLNESKVAIFGIGGVGSYVLEALVRAGIGNFILIDNDTISTSNINRQLLATFNTVGKDKTEVAKERILEINPNAKIETYKVFFLPETKGIIDDSIDYIIDAVDTIAAKLEIIKRANQYNVPVISSMGTGNKLDPTQFEVSDIYKTSVCPLAKVMRKELKLLGINKLKVVYSKENPIKKFEDKEDTNKKIPGSISFVPSVAGLIIASEVVKDLINLN